MPLFLKKHCMIPSGLGDFVGCIDFKAFHTFVASKSFDNREISVAEIFGKVISPKTSSNSTVAYSVVNKFLIKSSVIC